MKVKIAFITASGLKSEVMVERGTNLLEAAAHAGMAVEGNCGGKGSCGKCKVRLAKKSPEEPSEAEKKYLSPAELEDGWVLACQRTADEDMAVEVPEQSDAFKRKISLTEDDQKVKAEPAVRKIELTLDRPTVENQTPDLERLLNRLPEKQIGAPLRLLAGLPQILRKNNFAVTAVLAAGRLIAVEAGHTAERLFGVAFDIGTTTIMGSLHDLSSGKALAVGAATNPQNVFGADVISRITYAASGTDKLKRLQSKVIEALNGIIEELAGKAGIEPYEIYEVTAVGNTTMSHLFLGIDPTYLAPAPFVPAYRRAIAVNAAEIGLAINPGGQVLVLPNIAGYVGSDTVGVILATGLEKRRDRCAVIDIGTNGELALAAGGRILTCSTAAGPAFEGAQIKHGMRAADGAIEAVRIEGGEVLLETIGGSAPRGICGSGLIDAAAALLKADVLEPSGRLADPETTGAQLPPQLKARLRRGKGGFEFILAGKEITAGGEDIVLTQPDLRELQLAKGAIYAGLQILLKDAGLTETDLDEVLLAGAFGNYIRKESARDIGLLPGIPLEKITPVGNAAGRGARMALVSKTERARAEALPDLVEHVELSTRPDFQGAFIKALAFGRR
ncbi:MAG: ASKHA domain-containing protein [Dethiobacteria bacterium]|jgi:uncharacterized 2Fe-2S/4Fe-4S cluster protein (DUF4445 family)